MFKRCRKGDINSIKQIKESDETIKRINKTTKSHSPRVYVKCGYADVRCVHFTAKRIITLDQVAYLSETQVESEEIPTVFVMI